MRGEVGAEPAGFDGTAAEQAARQAQFGRHFDAVGDDERQHAFEMPQIAALALHPQERLVRREHGFGNHAGRTGAAQLDDALGQPHPGAIDHRDIAQAISRKAGQRDQMAIGDVADHAVFDQIGQHAPQGRAGHTRQLDAHDAHHRGRQQDFEADRGRHVAQGRGGAQTALPAADGRVGKRVREQRRIGVERGEIEIGIELDAQQAHRINTPDTRAPGFGSGLDDRPRLPD